MTLESLLKDYASFNAWANTEFVKWLKTKPQALMVQEVPSSFPSIQSTLLHVWGAEEIWLKRLQLISPIIPLTQRFSGDISDVFEGLENQSKVFANYVHDLTDADFQEVCSFKLLNGTEDSRSRAKMIHHCLNHSTYHRGQIVTMGHNLGLTDPPSTDYMKYVRLK